MSKIGKIPVIVKEGTTVVIENAKVTVTGAKGTLSYVVPEGISAVFADGKISVSLKEATENGKQLFGLTRSLINNMVIGVSEGFQKKLEMAGVGYRATMMGKDISLSVGFSHPVKFIAPEGIQFAVLENVIIVSGIDKTLVGNLAAQIRAVRPPEPYKGKGIKYAGEKIRRKAGKAAKAVGAK